MIILTQKALQFIKFCQSHRKNDFLRFKKAPAGMRPDSPRIFRSRFCFVKYLVQKLFLEGIKLLSLEIGIYFYMEKNYLPTKNSHILLLLSFFVLLSIWSRNEFWNGLNCFPSKIVIKMLYFGLKKSKCLELPQRAIQIVDEFLKLLLNIESSF